MVRGTPVQDMIVYVPGAPGLWVTETGQSLGFAGLQLCIQGKSLIKGEGRK